MLTLLVGGILFDHHMACATLFLAGHAISVMFVPLCRRILLLTPSACHLSPVAHLCLVLLEEPFGHTRVAKLAETGFGASLCVYFFQSVYLVTIRADKDFLSSPACFSLTWASNNFCATLPQFSLNGQSTIPVHTSDSCLFCVFQVTDSLHPMFGHGKLVSLRLSHSVWCLCNSPTLNFSPQKSHGSSGECSQ